MAHESDIKIAGRLHSTATGNVVAGADEIMDDTLGKKQGVINADDDRRITAVEEDINTPASGLKARIETLEGQVAFEGEFEVANNPDDIVSGSGKITTANAVRGVLDNIGKKISDGEMDEVLGGDVAVYLTDIDGNAVLDDEGKPIEII